MKRQLIQFLALTVGLSACQNGGGGSNPEVPTPKPAPIESPIEKESEKKVISAEGIEVRLSKNLKNLSFWNERERFISNLNKYEVQVLIPKSVLDEVKIYRMSEGNENFEELSIDNYELASEGILLKYPHQVTVENSKSPSVVYQVRTNEGATLVDVAFKLHPDLYIHGTQTLADLKLQPGFAKFAAIIFDEGTLYTAGADLELETEIFISHRGILKSFDDFSQAAVGLPGNQGGTVKIRSVAADGHLSLRLHGQQGGNGFPGEDNSAKPRTIDGAQGTPGQIGNSREFCYGSEGTFVRNEWMFFILGEDVSRFCPPHLYCRVVPGNGGKGEDGVRGGDGYPGQSGGDSGRFLFFYHEGYLETTNHSGPGLGGEGGVGGKGGPPGRGGAPGDRGYDHVCPAGRPGADGNPGETGKNGKMGGPGKELPSCVSKHDVSHREECK